MKVQTTDGSDTFTIRVPRDVKRRLDKLAKATHRSRSWLAADAVANYVEQQQWQFTEIEEGGKDADAGRVIPHKDVKRWLNSWGTSTEKAPRKWK